ncbi:hypothetical protein BD769DRAFT_1384077 [Suillus cothurnatus]|nr:hypothetical protein BD769DRAFT_1384077 [Suillus cothurnatus]
MLRYGRLVGGRGSTAWRDNYYHILSVWVQDVAYADRNAATAINHMSNYFFVYHHDIFSIRPLLSLEICPLITDALRTRPSDNEVLGVGLLGLGLFSTRRATWYKLWLRGRERRKVAWAVGIFNTGSMQGNQQINLNLVEFALDASSITAFPEQELSGDKVDGTREVWISRKLLPPPLAFAPNDTKQESALCTVKFEEGRQLWRSSLDKSDIVIMNNILEDRVLFTGTTSLNLASSSSSLVCEQSLRRASIGISWATAVGIQTSTLHPGNMNNHLEIFFEDTVLRVFIGRRKPL